MTVPSAHLPYSKRYMQRLVAKLILTNLPCHMLDVPTLAANEL